jgi:hypothetical protein
MSMTHVPVTHVGRPHLNPWLVVAVVLAALVVGLGVWVIVDQTWSSSVDRQASPEVVAMLGARLAALNRADAEAIASFFTADATLNDVMSGSPELPFPVVTGNKDIGQAIATGITTSGLQLESVPPIAQYGQTVVEAVKAVGSESPMDWLLVYRLAANGKIAYEWVLPAGDYETDFG